MPDFMKHLLNRLFSSSGLSMPITTAEMPLPLCFTNYSHDYFSFFIPRCELLWNQILGFVSF